MAAPTDAASREPRLLAMLHAISRSLSGAMSVPEAIAEITKSARELLDFERIAVLRREGENAMRVHASQHGVSWTEGRLLERADCSDRLWNVGGRPDRLDVQRELDPAFPMDREILERGTASILRVPLIARAGPIGWLAFSNARADAFDEQDETTASAIAGIVALALEHERLLTDEVRRQRRLAALDAVIPQLDEIHEIGALVTSVSRLAKPILSHEFVAIAVIHSQGARLHAVLPDGSHNEFDARPEEIRAHIATVDPAGFVIVRDIEVLDPQHFLVRLHLARGGERFTRDVPLPEGAYRMREQVGIRSQIRVAIRRGEEPVGILLFSSRTPDFFDDDDLALGRRFAERISLKLAQEEIEAETHRATEADERAQALESRVLALQRELEAARGPHAVVGASKSWREVLAHATRVAGTDTTVLLTGESGTGKEVVARFLHHASKRVAGPFVAINCAALPEQLLEAELFGHEKGAFTGAAAARTGRLEQAAGGVLFLDEVGGEMSPSVQAKFLRVLQEREFQRLGGARVLKADVRVIAATNRNLKAAIATGDFREDLYYRLHVFAIHLPPLRERPDDVLALAEHFLAELGVALGRGPGGMTAEARDALQHYAWPGNARELRNVIERALILCDGGLVLPSHLAISAADGAPAAKKAAPWDALEDGALPEQGVDLEQIERSLVRRAMAQVAGNKSKAARLLGLTRAQLYSRLEKFGL